MSTSTNANGGANKHINAKGKRKSTDRNEDAADLTATKKQKKQSSAADAAAAITDAAPPASSSFPSDSSSYDPITGDRKRHAPLGASKKKKPQRIAKHIQQAAARKQAKVAADQANAEMKEEKEDGTGGAGSAASAASTAPVAASAAKPRSAQSASQPSAPSVPLPESRLLALEYLQQWSTARAAWKFQKVRQLWLVEHLYDKESLGKKEFALVCEYIKDIKGAVRQRLFDEARKIVEEYQQWSANAEQRAANKMDTSATEHKDGDADVKKEATEADESEEETDKRKKRKAQRAEKVMSVLA